MRERALLILKNLRGRWVLDICCQQTAIGYSAYVNWGQGGGELEYAHGLKEKSNQLPISLFDSKVFDSFFLNSGSKIITKLLFGSFGHSSSEKFSHFIAVCGYYRSCFCSRKIGFDFSSFFILILQALAGDRECISKLKSSVKEMNKTGNSKSISNLFFLQ